MGEELECATVSQRFYMSCISACAVLTFHSGRVRSDFWDFSDGVCHAKKITTTDGNPDITLLT